MCEVWCGVGGVKCEGWDMRCEELGRSESVRCEM